MKVKMIKTNSKDVDLTVGKVYEYLSINEEDEAATIIDDIGERNILFKDQYEIVEEQKDEHYNNENGSLYQFANNHDLNAWEFDIIKRIVRCRKKGQFESDLEKTKRVIDLYLKEFKNK